MIGNPMGGLYFGLDVKACSTVLRIGRILENLSLVTPLYNRYGGRGILERRGHAGHSL
jgi:hypothetical protein